MQFGKNLKQQNTRQLNYCAFYDFNEHNNTHYLWSELPSIACTFKSSKKCLNIARFNNRTVLLKDLSTNVILPKFQQLSLEILIT